MVSGPVNGHEVKLFLQRAEGEDHICGYTLIANCGLFRTVWTGSRRVQRRSLDRYDMNILRISRDLSPPPSMTKWINLRTVVA